MEIVGRRGTSYVYGAHGKSNVYSSACDGVLAERTGPNMGFVIWKQGEQAGRSRPRAYLKALDLLTKKRMQLLKSALKKESGKEDITTAGQCAKSTLMKKKSVTQKKKREQGTTGIHLGGIEIGTYRKTGKVRKKQDV